MKIAILTNNRPNYSLILAQGLSRMLHKIGVPHHVFYDGLEMVYRPLFGSARSRASYKNLLANLRFLGRLRSYDLIVVVITIPEAFIRSCDIEKLRRFLPGTPIVQYANPFAGSSLVGAWLQRLKEGIPGHPHPDLQAGNNWGLDRYDWYLCSSATSQTPLSTDAPVSVIGANIDDGTLYPQQGSEFVALMDFERPDYLKERAIQIQAFEATNTRYEVLHGTYSVSQIRQIYRRCAIYFLACPESFGLPICELQACGARVFLPYAHWASAHWIKDVHLPGPGLLTSNFVVYDNDPQLLMEAIEKAKRVHDSHAVVQTLVSQQPQFMWGDIEALKDFLQRVDSGAIHSRSHEAYRCRVSWVMPATGQSASHTGTLDCASRSWASMATPIRPTQHFRIQDHADHE